MRTLRPAALALVTALAVAVGPRALAEDAAPGAATPPDLQAKASIRARLVEGRLIPGQKGEIEVVIALQDPRVHIEAAAANLKWSAPAQPGVEIGLDKVVITPEPTVHETEWGDTLHYHVGTFEARLPVRLKAEAPADAVAVVEIRYIQCSEESCGSPLLERLEIPLAGGPPQAALGAFRARRASVARGGAAVGVRLEEDPSRLVVRVEPDFGHHVYLPPKGENGVPIAVGVIGGAGVRWGEIVIPEGGEQHDPVEIEIPVTLGDEAEQLAVTVSWQACSGLGCLNPEEETFTFVREAPGGAAPPAGADAPVEAAPGAAAFPVVEDDAFEGGIEAESLIQEKLRETGLLVTLLLVFGVGAGLTFTPCVFPIIPLVVATIAGGQSIPKRRLLVLLGVYVLGLAMAFATMGVVAALTGSSISAAFESPLFIGGMALFFIVLSFGMLGLFELQPPQWLMRLQGGAQARGGSVLGAFMLGVLGAVLASPCTGPVIVGMLAATAATHDVLLGFSLFFTFGLGMGVIIALFGMANMALRPGPWMVWVRYVFGVLLFGGAMFYIANSALLATHLLWIAGIAVAVLSGALLFWHVTHREREPKAVGAKRGVVVSALYVGVLALVMFLNRQVEGLHFDRVRDVADLRARVAEATAQGKPVILDIWATWCQKCKEYDRVMAGDADLQARLADWVRLKIDVTDDQRNALRDAIGAPRNAQPWLAFIDAQGRLRKAAGAPWLGDGSGDDHKVAANRLRERLQRLAP